MSLKKVVLPDMVLIIYDHSKSLGFWIAAGFMITNSLILTSNPSQLSHKFSIHPNLFYFSELTAQKKDLFFSYIYIKHVHSVGNIIVCTIALQII